MKEFYIAALASKDDQKIPPPREGLAGLAGAVRVPDGFMVDGFGRLADEEDYFEYPILQAGGN